MLGWWFIRYGFSPLGKFLVQLSRSIFNEMVGANFQKGVMSLHVRIFEDVPRYYITPIHGDYLNNATYLIKGSFNVYLCICPGGFPGVTTGQEPRQIYFGPIVLGHLDI